MDGSICGGAIQRHVGTLLFWHFFLLCKEKSALSPLQREIVRGGEFVRICGRSKPLPYRGGMEFVRGGSLTGRPAPRETAQIHEFSNISKIPLTNEKIFVIINAVNQISYTEKYSSGRRGVTRNLVGRESVAWVQIPPSPPEKSTHFSTKTMCAFFN